MTGINPLTFWLSNVLWDGLIFLVSATAFVVALIALDEKDVFSSNGATGKWLVPLLP